MNIWEGFQVLGKQLKGIATDLEEKDDERLQVLFAMHNNDPVSAATAAQKDKGLARAWKRKYGASPDPATVETQFATQIQRAALPGVMSSMQGQYGPLMAAQVYGMQMQPWMLPGSGINLGQVGDAYKIAAGLSPSWRDQNLTAAEQMQGAFAVQSMFPVAPVLAGLGDAMNAIPGMGVVGQAIANLPKGENAHLAKTGRAIELEQSKETIEQNWTQIANQQQQFEESMRQRQTEFGESVRQFNATNKLQWAELGLRQMGMYLSAQARQTGDFSYMDEFNKRATYVGKIVEMIQAQKMDPDREKAAIHNAVNSMLGMPLGFYMSSEEQIKAGWDPLRAMPAQMLSNWYGAQLNRYEKELKPQMEAEKDPVKRNALEAQFWASLQSDIAKDPGLAQSFGLQYQDPMEPSGWGMITNPPAYWAQKFRQWSRGPVQPGQRMNPFNQWQGAPQMTLGALQNAIVQGQNPFAPGGSGVDPSMQTMQLILQSLPPGITVEQALQLLMSQNGQNAQRLQQLAQPAPAR